MSEFSEDLNSAKHAEEFLQMFKKGAEFTQELLRENERLRYQLLSLREAGNGQARVPDQHPEVARLRDKILELEREKLAILNRIKEIEEENLDFANRYVVVESENNMLANLYIASYRLHSTLDSQEVLQIVTEIVINLVGAEEFAVLLLDEKTGKFQIAAREGIDPDRFSVPELGKGVLGTLGRTGENYFVDDLAGYALDYDRPLAGIPLKIKNHVIGIIAIYKLSEPKSRFSQIDHELFTLLAGHAATALFASRLYSESERKLSTIQGFIKVLTK